MDHRCVLFSSVVVYTAPYLLLDMILSDVPCLPDDDSSYTGNSCY
jgi:hypothetical protein